MLGLWLIFVLLNFVISERIAPAGSKRAFLLYTWGGSDKILKKAAGGDTLVEKAHAEEVGKDEKAEEPLTSNSIFTWKNLNYTVKAGGKDLQLLNEVQGWCKPGQLTA